MIKCYLDDKTLLVQFTTTELDHHVATYIKENVDDIIMRKNIKNIIFDFHNIKFMDSSGIGVIIGRYKKIANVHGNVSVINMNPRVEKVFNLSGMGKIINVCKSYEDAINS